jgi:Holliday junction DNA helicase RuvA
MALAILSSISPSEFIQTVMQQDALSLTRLPGIGKKTAERLIIEMKDRLKDQANDLPYSGLNSAATPVNSSRLAQQEAISALVALGYKPQEASYAINQIADIESLNSEAIIRAALKALMKS